MIHGLSLLAEDAGDFVKGLSPESLALTDPGWATDLAAFGPWRPELAPLFTDSTACWRSHEGAQLPPTLVTGECASSLDLAWRLAALDRLPEWGTVLALTQTSGRGQLRRPWVSPPGNLYAAWRLPRDWPAGRRLAPELTPLLLGLMLSAGFESLGYATSIKWPNDILLNEKKICGVLVEERGGRLVAGVGVNLSHPELGVLERDPEAPAPGCLPIDKTLLGPLGFWLRLSSAGRGRLERELNLLDPEQVIELANERLAWLGERVQVLGAPLRTHGKVFDKWEGRIVGLSVHGSLRIMAEGEERLLTSGSLLAPRRGLTAGKA